MSAQAQPALQPPVALVPQPAEPPVAQQAEPPIAQPPTNWTPNAKVSVGVLGGALATFIVPMVALHWKSWTGQDSTPASIGAAVTSILTFVIQYWVPERK